MNITYILARDLDQFGPVKTPPFCQALSFLLKFQISSKAKMPSNVEMLKLASQCHQCLEVTFGTVNIEQILSTIKNGNEVCFKVFHPLL